MGRLRARRRRRRRRCASLAAAQAADVLLREAQRPDRVHLLHRADRVHPTPDVRLAQHGPGGDVVARGVRGASRRPHGARVGWRGLRGVRYLCVHRFHALRGRDGRRARGLVRAVVVDQRRRVLLVPRERADDHRRVTCVRVHAEASESPGLQWHVAPLRRRSSRIDARTCLERGLVLVRDLVVVIVRNHPGRHDVLGHAP